MGAFSSLASLGLAVASSRQAHKLQAKAAAIRAQEDERAAQIATAQANQASTADRRRRREAVRRMLAAQRARFGAAGIAPVGGSAEAALRGLVRKGGLVDQELAAANALRVEAIQGAQMARRRINLLERKGRLARGNLDILRGLSAGLGGLAGRFRSNFLED
jgi:hypothetical protein